MLDNENLLYILKLLPAGYIFVIVIIIILSMFSLSVLRLIQANRSKKKEMASNELSNALLTKLVEQQDRLIAHQIDFKEQQERLIDFQENKVRDILSIDGMKKVIERFYTNSQQDIQGLLADIYLKNNIHNPDRKEIIIHKIRTTINNAYNRDVADLNGLRYKNQRLASYMASNISSQILIDAITKKLYSPGFDSMDMHSYIGRTFEKFVTETIQFYENV